jgi:uncharacterized protein YggE
MKPIHQFLTILAGTLMAILLLALVAPQQMSAWAMTTPMANMSDSLSAGDPACTDKRTVQVSGSAAINVRPDRALIQLGVESIAATPEQVQADNSRAIQQITEAIRGLGIADKDIATDYYIIQPVYHDYKTLLINHYRIDNMIAVTLNDISKTSDVLLAALNAGANQVQNVQFYTSELRRYRDEARVLAMTAAAEKAQALAGAGGAQAGCLLQIHENSWSYYNGSWWGGRDRAMWTQNVVQNVAPAEPSELTDETPISTGQIVVRAEVNATFSLE